MQKHGLNTEFRPRVSYQNHHDIYFWTATIHRWFHLLEPDHFKDIIIESLRTLVSRKLANIFGFVIMPNHVHLIWQVLGLNGKESPQGSFLKFTAHQFSKQLISERGPSALLPYAVRASNKQFQFWQRDPMAIRLFNLDIALQKLAYSHNNPIADRWMLAADAESYRYSSARYYATGIDDFGMMSNLYNAFQYGF